MLAFVWGVPSCRIDDSESEGLNVRVCALNIKGQDGSPLTTMKETYKDLLRTAPVDVALEEKGLRWWELCGRNRVRKSEGRLRESSLWF